jgi:hypothetical protein
VGVLVGVDTEDDLLVAPVVLLSSVEWDMLGMGCSSPDRLGWRMATAVTRSFRGDRQLWAQPPYGRVMISRLCPSGSCQ